MVRTRDFLLLLLAVGFLLLAIAGTEIWQTWRTLPSLSAWWGAETSEVDYVAEVPAVTDERKSRLEVLRAKVAERLANNNEPDEVLVMAPVATSSTSTSTAATSTSTVAAVQTCAGYRSLDVLWVPQVILQENREGVRVYYERGLPDPLSSSTPELIRALVPLRSWPLPSSTCLPTDVVGIAMDGSLIRNNENALYTVFGGDTLVGYSLDGFPIYGPSQVATDACGGALVGGTYRYILDANRPGLITCFVGAPARIE